MDRPTKKDPPFLRRRTAERDLIEEITSAARSIDLARDGMGRPAFRTDGIWRVLTTVSSSPYCLTIADMARALRVRRQVGHELAHSAARAGLIELAPNPDDKRILQALLTPNGRAELAAGRSVHSTWLATVLNGLGDHEMATTTRVVRVIRQRLERDAREWAQLKASLAMSRGSRRRTRST
jgi:DNA-binding MarR family transcriptional regulator